MKYEFEALKAEASNATIVTALFFSSFLVVSSLITPLQAKVLPVEYVSILFLPHGIRILAAVIYGPLKGFLYLMFASIFVDLILGSDLPITSVSLIRNIIGSGCVPLSIILLRFGFGSEAISLQHVDRWTWRGLLLLIIVSSFLNSILQTVVIFKNDLTVTDVYLGLKFILGDVLGGIVVLVGAQILLKRIA